MNKFAAKRIIKNILAPFYRIFNLILFPLMKHHYFSKMEKLPRSSQLFFMTRLDLGPCLLQMHHAECWHAERGPACLAIFTTHVNKIVALAKFVCPNVEIIFFNHWCLKFLLSVFKNEIVQFYTFNPLYAHAICRWPHALFLYDMPFSRRMRYNVSCYISAFDPILQEPWPYSNELLLSYLHVRQFLDFRRPVFVDMMKLHYQCARKYLTQPKKTQSDQGELFYNLNIKTPYLVINLNCKTYRHPAQNLRRINYPERYNATIDFLISEGYTVVMQGREEQPTLAQRSGFVDYSRSPYLSPVNDFKIYANSAFSITCKTGPEIFCSICHVPVLGLNYAELCCITPNGRCRFYPKHLWDKKKKEFVHWREMLQRPCFFDMGYLSYEEEIEYVDLEEEELLQATQEFLALLPLPFDSWLEYTPLQRQFKQSLHPAHLDLYDVIDVPCDAYLSSGQYI